MLSSWMCISLSLENKIKLFDRPANGSFSISGFPLKVVNGWRDGEFKFGGEQS